MGLVEDLTEPGAGDSSCRTEWVIEFSIRQFLDLLRKKIGRTRS